MRTSQFQIVPRDVPAKAAAIRMGMTEVKFREELPHLIARGFPQPDVTTGNFDLNAIDAWCDRRHPALFVSKTETALDARAVFPQRLERLKNGSS